jgi:ABC-type transport system involved in multi-copper enzyme maturation permease subunit
MLVFIRGTRSIGLKNTILVMVFFFAYAFFNHHQATIRLFMVAILVRLVCGMALPPSMHLLLIFVAPDAMRQSVWRSCPCCSWLVFSFAVPGEHRSLHGLEKAGPLWYSRRPLFRIHLVRARKAARL